MKRLRKGFVFYLLMTLFLSVLFASYIVGDAAAEAMDGLGWVFFITSCVAHAGVLVLALWVLFFLPWALAGWRRLAAVLFVGASGLLAMSAFVNMQVYRIYRFHINGIVLNLLTGKGAGDIFEFGTMLYVEEAALLAGIVLVCAALWWAAGRMERLCSRRVAGSAVGSLVACLLISNGIHVYGAFRQTTSVLQSSRLVPYYFPLSATRQLKKMGFEPAAPTVDGSMRGGGAVAYPLKPLAADSLARRPNIVFVLIDSWNKRSLTPQCMPNVWQMAGESQWFDNHLSSSNGTRYSVFSLFTGIEPYYWPAFEATHTSPALVDALLLAGYDVRAYPSATLQSPPFDRLLFQRLPSLRLDTEGSTPYQRDERIARDLVADLPALQRQAQPFFAFIFFDLPHGLMLPKDKLTTFQPSWEYADYAKLSNDMDPTPFWNLYRNICHETDRFIGSVMDELKRLGMYEETIVVVTGDHGQEFNENHKNYWGHSGNFTVHQVGVPFILHDAAKPAAKFSHRTTHYDLVPTLLHDYLGIVNPPGDYSSGHLLSDTTARRWHFVGNELRYAFLVEGDTIITKEGGGWMEVTDARLNLVKDYHVKPRDFDRAMRRLNRFFK